MIIIRTRYVFSLGYCAVIAKNLWKTWCVH